MRRIADLREKALLDEKAIRRKGYQDGHDKGYLAGRSVGYEDGRNKGYEDGHSEGLKDGISKGIKQGFEYNIPIYVDTIKEGYPILCA